MDEKDIHPSHLFVLSPLFGPNGADEASVFTAVARKFSVTLYIEDRSVTGTKSYDVRSQI